MWRLAHSDDYSTIVSMWQKLNQEDPSSRTPADHHMEVTLKTLAQEPVRGRPVVLEVNGKIEGYELLISFWSNELGGEVCEIDELHVSENCRGQGHGSSLVKLLRDKNSLWPRQIVAIHLEVSPKNSRARQLYESLGFVPLRNSVMRLQF